MVANKINLSLRQTRTYFTLIQGEKTRRFFVSPRVYQRYFFLLIGVKKNNRAKTSRNPLCASASLRAKKIRRDGPADFLSFCLDYLRYFSFEICVKKKE